MQHFCELVKLEFLHLKHGHGNFFVEAVEKIVPTFSLSGVEGGNRLFLNDASTPRSMKSHFDFFDRLIKQLLS